MFDFFNKHHCKNENLYRTVVEAIRSSLDLNKTIKTIIDVVGKTLNADRCFIMEYDKQNDRFIESQEEYLSSSALKSYLGVDLNEHIPHFVSEFKKGKRLIFNALNSQIEGENINLNDGSFEKEKIAKEEYKVYSALVFPLFHVDEFLGDLVVHYVDKKHNAGEEEINLLTTVSNQIAIAIYQARLFEQTEKQSKKEELLRKIIESIRNTLDTERTLEVICKEVSHLFNVQRVAIVSLPDMKNYEAYSISKEYKTSLDIKGLNDVGDFSKAAAFWGENLVLGKEILDIENIEKADAPEEFKNKYKLMGVKSIIGISIKNGEDVWGNLVLSEYGSYRHWTNEEKVLLKTITDQIYIALKQAEAYSKQKHMAERERLLRSIIEKIRSSLDTEKIFDFVCEEIAKNFNVQRVAISEFLNDCDKKIVLKKEYKQNPQLLGYSSIEDYTENANWVCSILNKNSIFAVDNLHESDVPVFFKNSFMKLGIKSIIGASIKNDEDTWGMITLSEYNEYRKWSDEEKKLLETIADQVYIAINQAELYESQKNMAEREKISRNIVEILRSSMDKAIIKKLFVKNIGKFFGADRVFFSEYDKDKMKFMPVDKDSEYLSSSDEKSFIGIDWAQHCIREYCQSLYEKREIKILSMAEYMKDKQLDGNIRDLIEESKVKSSYSFPVFYQDKILGTFSLDFTQENTKLSDEDVNRIRSMCTQAGIALYHAALYEEAQKCFQTRNLFILEYSEKIKKPTDEILDKSTQLSENEFERTVQIVYLNQIIEACNELLELTRDISEN